MSVPVPADYLLDPDLVFLNNGSFGAVPRFVQTAYEQLQRDMERNPVEWLARSAPNLLAVARANVARYVGAAANDVVFFPNPTMAANMVAHALHLAPGDEVIATDHEYGAMFRTWTRLCQQADATYTRVHIPLPYTTDDDYIERVWSAVTPRTRVLFLDQLTSATALILPVDELCRRAREAGVISIVDGAHVHPSESQFIDYHEWQGTRDLSPFLAATAAIQFVDPTTGRRCRRKGIAWRCSLAGASTR